LQDLWAHTPTGRVGDLEEGCRAAAAQEAVRLRLSPRGGGMTWRARWRRFVARHIIADDPYDESTVRNPSPAHRRLLADHGDITQAGVEALDGIQAALTEALRTLDERDRLWFEEERRRRFHADVEAWRAPQPDQ
jgi:hypothetical protein